MLISKYKGPPPVSNPHIHIHLPKERKSERYAYIYIEIERDRRREAGKAGKQGTPCQILSVNYWLSSCLSNEDPESSFSLSLSHSLCSYTLFISLSFIERVRERDRKGKERNKGWVLEEAMSGGFKAAKTN